MTAQEAMLVLATYRSLWPKSALGAESVQGAWARRLTRLSYAQEDVLAALDELVCRGPAPEFHEIVAATKEAVGRRRGATPRLVGPTCGPGCTLHPDHS